MTTFYVFLILAEFIEFLHLCIGICPHERKMEIFRNCPVQHRVSPQHQTLTKTK